MTQPTKTPQKKQSAPKSTAQPKGEAKMAQNTAKNFFDPMSMMKDAKMPPIDFEGLMATHRKNLEALTKAQKCAMDAFKSVTEMNTSYARQAMDDMNHNVRGMMTARTAEERMQMGSQTVKASLEKAMGYGKDVSDNWTRSMQELAGHVGGRFQEGMKEAQHIFNKPKN